MCRCGFVVENPPGLVKKKQAQQAVHRKIIHLWLEFVPRFRYRSENQIINKKNKR
jgi:hypothetical protein